MKKRVVITGMGVITPNACNTPQFLSALKNGQSGISNIQSFDASKMRSCLAGEIKNFLPVPPELDRTSCLALIAAKEAVEKIDASLAPVFWAMAGGGNLTFERFILDGKVDPFLAAKLFPGASAKVIAEHFGCRGGCFTVTNACAAGGAAIGLAMDHIRAGKVPLAIVGGSEAFSLTLFSGFHALRSVDPVACRPFDRERQGLVIGEGAGCLVLESLENAVERGTQIYAEVLGYGLSSDAYHETAPEPNGEGAARSIETALADAGIGPSDISYINAHGTGTPQNDRMETLALKKVFGKRAYDIPTSSTKSMIGHLMGAAGIVEAVTSILAINHFFIPPTINYKVPDPECDLDYVPNQARAGKVETVLSNNFGFGGNNAAVIFRRMR